MDCSISGLPVLHHLLKLVQVHVHFIGDAILSCDTLFSFFLWCLRTSRIFQWVVCSHQWPKYWNFSFSINPSSEYSGFIYLKIDWFDLFTVQRTLRSLLQHHSSKASILWRSAFLNGPALTTIHDHWEDHNLDSRDLCWQSHVSTFQHTVYVCHCFPSQKQSSSEFMAALTICSDFGAQEEEICLYFLIFPFYLSWSNGARCHDLSFFNI